MDSRLDVTDAQVAQLRKVLILLPGMLGMLTEGGPVDDPQLNDAINTRNIARAQERARDIDALWMIKRSSEAFPNVQDSEDVTRVTPRDVLMARSIIAMYEVIIRAD